nr:hypothetical protein [uncultured Capnocytophaga sp.]
MARKILLFTLVFTGLIACSKADDQTVTPDKTTDGNLGKEKLAKNKLLGEWTGTFDIISESPAKKERVIEILKRIDSNSSDALNKKFDYTKARVVFEEGTITLWNALSSSIINRFDQYEVKENTIIDKETFSPIISYSIQNNVLIGEEIEFKYHHFRDEENIAKETEDALNKYITGNLTETQYNNFLKEVEEKNNLKFRFKFIVTKK